MRVKNVAYWHIGRGLTCEIETGYLSPDIDFNAKELIAKCFGSKPKDEGSKPQNKEETSWT